MISVIFSTYNSEEWLEKVIWGFSVQTFKDFELIISDNASDDETENICKKFALVKRKTMQYGITETYNGGGIFTLNNIINNN